MTQRTKPVCSTCGSDDVCRDANAMWDEDAQQWALGGTYDSTTCNTCEEERDLTWVQIESTTKGTP